MTQDKRSLSEIYATGTPESNALAAATREMLKAEAAPVTYEPFPMPAESNAALVVGPDDVLVMSFPDITPEQVDELKAQLRERHPQLVERVLFIGGAEHMAVIRDGAP